MRIWLLIVHFRRQKCKIMSIVLVSYRRFRLTEEKGRVKHVFRYISRLVYFRSEDDFALGCIRTIYLSNHPFGYYKIFSLLRAIPLKYFVSKNHIPTTKPSEAC